MRPRLLSTEPASPITHHQAVHTDFKLVLVGVDHVKPPGGGSESSLAGHDGIAHLFWDFAALLRPILTKMEHDEMSKRSQSIANQKRTKK